MNAFLSRLAGWMTTSSSILGTAVGTPVVAAALTGVVPWQQAILPIVGSLIAIAMPQVNPVPQGVVVTNAVPVPPPPPQDAFHAGLDFVGQAAAAASNAAAAVSLMNPAAGAALGIAGKAVPSLLDALSQAADDFQKAQAQYTALRDQAQAQAQALTAAALPAQVQANAVQANPANPAQPTYTPGVSQP